MPSQSEPNGSDGTEGLPAQQLNVTRLARAGASWRGTVGPESFRRIRDMLADRDVRVSLDFSMDGQGRPRVVGNCRLTVDVCCGRCSETASVEIDSPVDFRVVATEDEAQQLMPSCDVVVAEGMAMRVADLVEDDLLLSVPANGCPDPDACLHARDLAASLEGLAESVEGTEVAEVAKPFAALRDLAAGGSRV